MKEKELEKVIGYTFSNPKYLTIALSHTSYVNEVKRGLVSNERQEFLGDAVLSIVASDYLFKHYSHLPEGELTKLRASLVCEKSLCEFAHMIGLGQYLMLGRGEEQMGGRERPSILADAFEALIAAIYLDGGMEHAKKFILGFVKKQVEKDKKVFFKDYKTALQELVQREEGRTLVYELLSETGPDHNKTFTFRVLVNGIPEGEGSGHSKKEAEQSAARDALHKLEQK